ncbi:MAG: HEPN domain-containing protein [Microcoleus sp. PH2017_10_PVI_O_A]|uniref:HEPN domain-containing protein n=1 Tax=unclassified Microcoleus TaxID=2642155 RepID=UPI001DC79613|nr:MULTISPECIES: HEPN domain-containing protein [unclassified Microcoleus]TAE79529.1 MAG: HEPN domain-containing protein [Oscillatoriales cyanobacterium]MCC3408211.1 HEPN domain-containing protein [Microcoleus sp. PH2017_10_PVI_O_A]MCC3462281.1 HEPN domain-containing protein [Microcoleus sp. PH2017_11_PCY_U_A]MCC3480756.1 HEPN domain-containing protein [Microcoleus sp. PH2017_12_PCY_D_A]MCC3530682.1 HEPN domain-containing protein [Microcoleus sp. PH2017_21_RUC_O_A]
MKFDWSEYLNLAQELAARNEESKLRSAVSRAYYSVFCLARNYLRDIEQDPRLSRNKTYDINDHQYVAEEFIYNRSKSQKITEIGRNLTRLRKIRNQADYEDTIFQLQKEVVRSLSLAQNIISALRELSD